MFLLPQQSHSILKPVLMQLMERATSIKFCLIKNIKDETGEIVLDLIRPRYIAFYGRKNGAVDQAIFYFKQILGDSFDYEIAENYGLPPEIDNSDMELVTLLNSFYDRSRFICAEDFIKNFMGETLSTNEVIANILSSTLILQVRSSIVNNSKIYEANFITRPTMGIVKYKNNLVHTNVLNAVEEVSKVYKNMVDINFDTFQIDYDGKVSQVIHPPESGVELFELFRKSILDSSNLEA